jgi:hypothetical protein
LLRYFEDAKAISSVSAFNTIQTSCSLTFQFVLQFKHSPSACLMKIMYMYGKVFPFMHIIALVFFGCTVVCSF